jgi:hypothetical protein
LINRYLKDDRLKDAFKYHPKDWVKAAQLVGCGVKKDQCRNRWNLYVDPASNQLKRGIWSEDEVFLVFLLRNELIKCNRKSA